MAVRQVSVKSIVGVSSGEKKPYENQSNPIVISASNGFDDKENTAVFFKFDTTDIVGGVQTSEPVLYLKCTEIDRSDNYFDIDISVNRSEFSNYSRFLLPQADVENSNFAVFWGSTDGDTSNGYPFLPYYEEFAKLSVSDKLPIRPPLISDIELNKKTWLKSVLMGFASYFFIDNKKINMYGVYTFEGIGSETPPELILTLRDVDLHFVPITQSGVFVNKSNHYTVEYGFSYDDDPEKDYVVGTIRSLSSVFKYREKGETNFLEIFSPYGEYCVIPANTFVSGDYEWSVEITMESGVVVTGDTYQLTTIDSLPETKIIRPKNTIISNNEPNRFEVSHQIATGSAIQKTEMQYSANGGQSWVLFYTINGSDTAADVPANSLIGGNLIWRARAFNSDNAAGEWSPTVPIVVYGAPPAPVLLPIDPVSNPTIRWQSTEQQGFEVQIDNWSFGAQYGSQKYYTPPLWLTDGDHVARVRIQSELGVYSNFSQQSFTVKNNPPGTIALETREINHGVKLRWVPSVSFEKYVIYRDGKAIAETTETVFTDFFAIGKHRYFVRGVSGQHFAASNNMVGCSNSVDGAISLLQEISFLQLKMRRGERPSVSVQSQRDTTRRFVYGKTLPVLETSPYVQSEKTYDYSFSPADLSSLSALRSLLGQQVLVKSQRDMSIGVMNNLSEQVNSISIDVSFTVIEMDWSEYDGY